MLRHLSFLFIVLFCGVVCEKQAVASNDTNGAVPAMQFNDTNQIRVAVYAYLIKQVIKPPVDSLLFIAADYDELPSLKAKFPGLVIKPAGDAKIVGNEVRDKATGTKGTILAVQWINTTNANQANVHAGYFSGAGVTYDFQLHKNGGWQIDKVSKPTVHDVF